jgi:hypothetical protein
MLTSRELTSMRLTVESAFPDSMQIIARVSATTAHGGTSYEESTGPAIPCRFEDLTGEERLVAEQVQVRAERAVRYPSSVALEAGSRVESGGCSYEVTYVEPARSWRLNGKAFLVAAS